MIALDKTTIALNIEYANNEAIYANDVNFHFIGVELLPYYESCFSTVGYKRPEIQEYGRQLTPFLNASGEENDRSINKTTDGSFLCGTAVYPLTTQSPNVLLPLFTFPTGIPWTDENLTNFKNFFESQETYPELFSYNSMSASQQSLINTTNTSGVDDEGINVSPDKMRYLHCNVRQGDDAYVYVTISAYTTDPIYGGYITVDSTTGVEKGMIIFRNSDGTLLFPENTFITKVDGDKVYVSKPPLDPSISAGEISLSKEVLGNDYYFSAGDNDAGALFFDYNPDRKDIIDGEGNGIVTYDSLTYGYAKKYKDSNKNEFIGLSVEKYQYGTLPSIWFDSGVVLDARCIGFDKHFNAYGTSAILLSNGKAGLWGGQYDPNLVNGSVTDNDQVNIAAADVASGRDYSTSIKNVFNIILAESTRN